MQEVYDFLKKCGTYYLATVDGSKPKVRPFGTVDIFENKLYVQTGKVKPTSKQIHTNPYGRRFWNAEVSKPKIKIGFRYKRRWNKNGGGLLPATVLFYYHYL